MSNSCFSCGRCCFGPEDYVQVFAADARLLEPGQVAALVVGRSLPRERWPKTATASDRFMRMQDGHCAALDLRDGQFRCSIYERRPLICRVYQEQAPSSACLPSPGGEPLEPNPYRSPG